MLRCAVCYAKPRYAVICYAMLCHVILIHTPMYVWVYVCMYVCMYVCTNAVVKMDFTNVEQNVSKSMAAFLYGEYI